MASSEGRRPGPQAATCAAFNGSWLGFESFGCRKWFEAVRCSPPTLVRTRSTITPRACRGTLWNRLLHELETDRAGGCRRGLTRLSVDKRNWSISRGCSTPRVVAGAPWSCWSASRLIGKTALCEELGVAVTAAGGQTLVGHCYAEGSFRPPYQPFVEALDTYVQGSNPQALTADLGSGAVELARTLPTLGEQLNFPPRSAGDPEEDRWQLLQAATQLLRVAVMHRPLLLVLEDLHDADRGALDLLLHLARNLGTAPALVVGWCCGVCPSRGHSHPSSVSYPSWWRPSIWPMGSTGSWPTSAIIACSSSGLSWTHPGSSGRGGDIRSRPLVSSVLTCVCR